MVHRGYSGYFYDFLCLPGLCKQKGLRTYEIPLPFLTFSRPPSVLCFQERNLKQVEPERSKLRWLTFNTHSSKCRVKNTFKLWEKELEKCSYCRQRLWAAFVLLSEEQVCSKCLFCGAIKKAKLEPRGVKAVYFLQAFVLQTVTFTLLSCVQLLPESQRGLHNIFDLADFFYSWQNSSWDPLLVGKRVNHCSVVPSNFQ